MRIDTDLLNLVLPLAAASIVMVVAMVRFSIAIVAEPMRATAVKCWGTIYAAALAVVAGVIVRASMMPSWPEALAAGTLIVGGWATFQAFWIWLWLGIARTNARTAGSTPALTPAREHMMLVAGRCALAGLAAVMLAATELGHVQSVIAMLVAPEHRAVKATMSVAVVGSVLFLGGCLRLMLSQGQAMSHGEIEREISRNRLGMARGAMAAYRQVGPAVGSSTMEELSIPEMKKAFLSGLWRQDRRWQSIFIVTAGALMMMYGGFGAAIVAGPMYVQVICGGALAYTTYQLISAIRRS